MRKGLIFAALLLPSCLPTETGSVAIGSSQSASAPPSESSASPFSLPVVTHPETMLVRAERLLTQASPSGESERIREILWADGQGAFRLDVDAFSAYASGPLNPPPPLLVASYRDRQRYLIRFRDIRLGLPEIVHKNWVWETLPETYALAGVACTQHRATSRHGFGTVTLQVNPANSVLMGWEILDGRGELIRRLETTTLDFNPDVSSIVWSSAVAAERDWEEGDEALLGVTPLQARYLPPGFEFTSERLVEASQSLSGVPDIHFQVSSDGLLPLIIAQHQAQNASGGGAPGEIETARWSRYGGIQVVEGQIAGRQAYLVSTLEPDELLAVLGSLLP